MNRKRQKAKSNPVASSVFFAVDGYFGFNDRKHAVAHIESNERMHDSLLTIVVSTDQRQLSDVKSFKMTLCCHQIECSIVETRREENDSQRINENWENEAKHKDAENKSVSDNKESSWKEKLLRCANQRRDIINAVVLAMHKNDDDDSGNDQIEMAVSQWTFLSSSSGEIACKFLIHLHGNVLKLPSNNVESDLKFNSTSER